MGRGRWVLLGLALAAATAQAAQADHLRSSPKLFLTGGTTVPPTVIIVDTRTVPDPSRGAWKGFLNWDVSCPGGERFAWAINFADVADGGHGAPHDVRPRQRSHVVFYFSGSGYSVSSTGRDDLTIPAGASVYPYIESRCYLFSTNSHESPLARADGPILHVPPYIWAPRFDLPPTRSLDSIGLAYAPLALERIPRRRVVATLNVRHALKGNERLEVHFQGAGVKVTRTYDAARLDRRVQVALRPRKRGLLRHWAVVRPYGVRSNVIAVRVR